MAFADFLPAPMARMTVAAPLTASPPAKMPGREVVPTSSATMQPLRLRSRLRVVLPISGLGEVPNAMIIMSTSSDAVKVLH